MAKTNGDDNSNTALPRNLVSKDINIYIYCVCVWLCVENATEEERKTNLRIFGTRNEKIYMLQTYVQSLISSIQIRNGMEQNHSSHKFIVIVFVSISFRNRKPKKITAKIASQHCHGSFVSSLVFPRCFAYIKYKKLTNFIFFFFDTLQSPYK